MNNKLDDESLMALIQFYYGMGLPPFLVRPLLRQYDVTYEDLFLVYSTLGGKKNKPFEIKSKQLIAQSGIIRPAILLRIKFINPSKRRNIGVQNNWIIIIKINNFCIIIY